MDMQTISRLIQPRVVRLTDIPEMVAFFARPAPHGKALYVNDKAKSTLDSSRTSSQVLSSCSTTPPSGRMRRSRDAVEWARRTVSRPVRSCGRSE